MASVLISYLLFFHSNDTNSNYIKRGGKKKLKVVETKQMWGAKEVCNRTLRKYLIVSLESLSSCRSGRAGALQKRKMPEFGR